MTQKGNKVVIKRRATATSATFRFLNPRNPPQPAASVNSHQLTTANPRGKRDRRTVGADVFNSARAAVTFQKSELKFSSLPRLRQRNIYVEHHVKCKRAPIASLGDNCICFVLVIHTACSIIDGCDIIYWYEKSRMLRAGSIIDRARRFGSLDVNVWLPVQSQRTLAVVSRVWERRRRAQVVIGGKIWKREGGTGEWVWCCRRDGDSFLQSAWKQTA